MRKVDAPGAGWYPDPEHRERLRWWDGLDWTDIKRAPPSGAELLSYEEDNPVARELAAAAASAAQGQRPRAGGMAEQDVNQIIAQVQQVARSEIDRAAQEFSSRATTAVRSISPLISDYTSTALRWVKRAVIIAIVLLVAYFVFQVIVQASFFEWLGDRIDNLTDDSSGQAPTVAQFTVGAVI